MATVAGSTRGRPGRRVGPGAEASRRILRWPSRNYFAEIEPHPSDEHPVLSRIDSAPSLRPLRAKARGFLDRLRSRTHSRDILGFEAARNHLDTARVEVAYNLGFEAGAMIGRAEGLRYRLGPRKSRNEQNLLLELRALLSRASASRDRIQALLLEICWSLALENRFPKELAMRPSSNPGAVLPALTAGRRRRNRSRQRRSGGRRS
jgi:hypothetical protein